MSLRRIVAAFVAATPILLLAGCTDNDAEQAVEDAAGVEAGSEKQTADVDSKTYRVEDTRTVIDAQTGEVVGEKASTTDVSVQAETTINREVEVESGETTTETKGFVPEGLDDQ